MVLYVRFILTAAPLLVLHGVFPCCWLLFIQFSKFLKSTEAMLASAGASKAPATAAQSA